MNTKTTNLVIEERLVPFEECKIVNAITRQSFPKFSVNTDGNDWYIVYHFVYYFLADNLKQFRYKEIYVKIG